MKRRPFPILTAVTLSVAAALTATRLITPAVMHALWRDPTALGRGQVWRVITPALVQSDRSPSAVLLVFVLCAVIGTSAEWAMSRRRWLTLYLVGGVVGEAIGEVFQPHQSGISVAFAGVLGGLAAEVLIRGGSRPRPQRIQAALAIPAALADTMLGDIHGLPFLAGLLLASAWLVADAHASPNRRSVWNPAGVASTGACRRLDRGEPQMGLRETVSRFFVHRRIVSDRSRLYARRDANGPPHAGGRRGLPGSRIRAGVFRHGEDGSLSRPAGPASLGGRSHR